MENESLDLTGELYPIERVLVCGPLDDAILFGSRARAAGHVVTLLLTEDDTPRAPKNFPRIDPDNSDEKLDFDLAIELHCVNITEKADTLFLLDDSLGAEVPIITLTNAVTTGEIARDMNSPERVVGICLLPPFEETKAAELMANPKTSADALGAASRLCESINLRAVRVEDSPGGVLVRTVCCLINEAALALQERIASAPEIDSAMQLGVSYPSGPLEWGDRIGLDRVLAVMDGLFDEYKEERYRPVPLLKKYVRAGTTGKSAGRGFFSYA